MASMRCCVRFGIAPSWIGSVFLFPARSWSIRSCGRHHDGVSASPPEWLDDRLHGLDKTRYPCPDIAGKVTRLPYGFNNQGQPPLAGTVKFNAQVQRDQEGTQEESAGSYEGANEFREFPELDITNVLLRMDQQATVPSLTMYRSLLKVCAKRKALLEAKRVHAHLFKHGLESTRFLGEYVVSTLAKCNGLEDALQVFERLPRRGAFSWTAIISGQGMSGQGREALETYQSMRKEGVEPNSYTFISLLQACSSIPDLEEGKRIHKDVCEHNCQTDLFVSTSLIDMYGKCGSITDAQNVFAELSQHDVASWNAILGAYVQHGQAEKAFECYKQMLEEGEVADARTFVSMLQACGMLVEKEEADGTDLPITKMKCLDKVKVIYAQARNKGYDADFFVGNSLLSVFKKCGSIMDAQNVFDELPHQNMVSWNALLAAYVEQGQPQKGLQLYQQMQEERVSPDAQTVVSMLQGCGMLSEKEYNAGGSTLLSFQRSKAMHADARRRGYDIDAFLSSTLIYAYAKCRSIVDAWNLFDGLSERNVVTWNVILAAYVDQGLAEKVLELYEEMCKDNVNPNNRTSVSMLQACGILAEKEEDVLLHGQSVKVRSLERVKEVHAYAGKMGYNPDVFVGSMLVSTYGKCGSIGDAQSTFDELSQRNCMAWTAMLASHVGLGQADKALQLYEQMTAEGMSPEGQTFVSVLQACGILAEKECTFVSDGGITKAEVLKKGKAIHAYAFRKGYGSDVFLCTTLISMYGKCGSLVEAENVFNGLIFRNVMSWTAMLSVHVAQGQTEKALHLYEQMQEEGVTADDRTFVVVLQACCLHAENDDLNVDGSTKPKLLVKGKVIHSEAWRKGYELDALVCSTLVSMYGKFGELLDAQYAFDGLAQKTVVCWAALLSAYAQQGQPEKAMDMYEQMQEQAVSPNYWSIASVLSACGLLAEKEEDVLISGRPTKSKYLGVGKAIHADARRQGYDSYPCVGNALINMYGKCGSIWDAQDVFFNGLCQGSAISWNAMLSVYVDYGQEDDALSLYRQLQQEGMSPDVWTFVRALQACGNAAEKEEDFMVEGLLSIKPEPLQMVKSVHSEVRRKGYDFQVFISSTLISAYGKCGGIADAQVVFDGLPNRNIVSWTALLSAYIDQGQAEKSFELYRRMQEHGPSPNDATLVCMVQACSKTGNLPLLRKIHQTVVSRGQDVSPWLSSVLISAYGRCASMKDAETVFTALPQPDAVSWNALISGHARQGDCAASLQLFDQMQLAGVKPTAVTFVSVLSACSHAGLVEKGVEYFEAMSRDHGICPGMEHYVSMVDLLGRAGWFARVEDLLSALPIQPSLAMWSCLLAACQKHGKVLLGKQAFDLAVQLHPKHAAVYLLMSNIYADAGLLEHAKEVQKLRQTGGAWKKPGQCWLEHEQEIRTFLVDDCQHPQQKQLYDHLIAGLN